jgi:hypothetical protein
MSVLPFLMGGGRVSRDPPLRDLIHLNSAQSEHLELCQPPFLLPASPFRDSEKQINITGI